LFELVRTFPSSFFVKIRMSRAQKQILFAFAEAKYLQRNQRSYLFEQTYP